MKRFTGKIVFVTGGASGIGRSIVERLVNEEATVFVTDINMELLAKLEEDMNTLQPNSCVIWKCDVFDSSQITQAINEAWKQFGTVDVLINNAGGSMNGPIHLLDLTEEHFDTLISFNVKNLIVHSQEFMKKHLECGTVGVITNLVSQAGIQPNEYARPAYVMAKAAAIGLTKHMAKEFGYLGFRINAVAPGYCASGERIAKIWEMRGKETTELLLRSVSLGRISSPDEQASAVAFLSSDDASYITGEILNTMGGGY